MKTSLIIAAVAIAAVVCAIVAGRRMLLRSRRPTAATIPLANKPKGKIAIVYYSQSQVQNTALVAKWIQKHVGGDLLPIEMVEPYPDAYFSTIKASYKHRKNGIHPAIKPVPALDEYDIVFIGSPICYGTYAPPVATFFDSNRLAGKSIAPFCTHGGGGAGRFFDDIRAACPEAKVLDGLSIRGSNQIERRLNLGVTSHHTEDDVVNWLNELWRDKR